MNEKIELHALFKGKVQGVGFRWTLVDHAENHSLTGTVQNLPDGSVEVYAQGSKESLDAFLLSVKSSSGSAKINSISCNFQSIKKSFKNFLIVY